MDGLVDMVGRLFWLSAKSDAKITDNHETNVKLGVDADRRQISRESLDVDPPEMTSAS